MRYGTVEKTLIMTVLLSDGWHVVEDGSFRTGPFELVMTNPGPADRSSDFELDQSASPMAHYGLQAAAFTFKSEGTWITGFLSSIVAVGHSDPDADS